MRISPFWWVVASLILLGGGGTLAVKYAKFRGLRNNNPGNIKHGAQWEGMAPTQTDPTFITFVSPEYGIRAMARILKNYQSKWGLNTLDQVIRRWSATDQD